MANKRRKLYLHVGTQKTGSSFLQHMLRRNAATLYDVGVSYLQFEEDLVGSGNGKALIEASVSEGVEPPFELYFGKHSVAIVSSELMYSAGFNWLKIFRAAKAENIKIVVVAFFRNPASYLLGSYSQSVSRHGYAKTLEDFISEFSVDLYVGPLKKAQRAAEVTEAAIEWHLKSYDACRGRLFEEFLLACDLDTHRFTTENVRVNPSLNANQLKLLQLYNARIDSDVSSSFSRFMVSSSMLGEGPPLAISSKLMGDIERKFADPLQFVNALLSGEPVSVSADEALEITEESRSLELEEPDICKLIEFFASNTSLSQNLHALLERVTIRCKEVHLDVLKRFPDFDPIHYLVSNPDLLMADVNPYRHFNDHGFDEGRTYKIDIRPPQESPAEKPAKEAEAPRGKKRVAR